MENKNKINDYMKQVDLLLPYSESVKREVIDELRVDVESAVEDSQGEPISKIFGQPDEVARNICKSHDWHIDRAGWGSRIGAWLIDLIVKFLVIGLITAGMFLFLILIIPYEELVVEFSTWEKSFELSLLNIFLLVVISTVTIIAFAFMFVYNIIFERYYGATLGKMLLGLLVVDQHGVKIFWRQAIIRNLSKVVSDEFIPFFLPVDFILGIILERQDPNKVCKQRAFDVLAETIVIKKK